MATPKLKTAKLIYQCSYSLWSSCWSWVFVGLKIQFSKSPVNRSPAKRVASMKPYLAFCPKASLTAPIAKGPKAAPAAVKNKITPATAPCSTFGKQLMPFEFSVG